MKATHLPVAPAFREGVEYKIIEMKGACLIINLFTLMKAPSYTFFRSYWMQKGQSRVERKKSQPLRSSPTDWMKAQNHQVVVTSIVRICIWQGLMAMTTYVWYRHFSDTGPFDRDVTPPCRLISSLHTSSCSSCTATHPRRLFLCNKLKPAARTWNTNETSESRRKGIKN